MSDTHANSTPDAFEVLKHGGASYHFVMETGHVVGDPACSDDSISFFLKDDKDLENDITLQTSLRARPGHRVSVLYVSKNSDEFAKAVAWVNHTTGKVDYLQRVAREIVGNRIAMFFLDGSAGLMTSINNLIQGSRSLVFFVTLPITAGFLALSMLFLVVGGLFGLKSEKSTSRIMRQAEQIVVSLDPSYAAYSGKTSRVWKVFKWAGITVIAVIALGFMDGVRRQYF